MMNKKLLKIKIVFALTLLVSSNINFVIGSSAPMTPPIPRLAATPDSYAWSIQYQYVLADPYPQTSNLGDQQVYALMRRDHPRIQIIEVTKAGLNLKKVEKYEDGSETINWQAGGFLITDERLTHFVSVASCKEIGLNTADDFRDLDWIDKAECKGQQNYQGTNCWVYKQDAQSVSEEKTAYIDVKTSWPKAIQTAKATWIYSFHTSTDGVELPEKYLAALKAHKKDLRAGQF